MPKKEHKKKVGSAGRLGPRYGTRVRARVRAVEDREKGYHRCPECRSKSVKRVASGIWECQRCETKFAAKAYTPSTTPIEREISPTAEESGTE
ncbi:hypothetical protein AKJ65_00195 [candidate division MSBL1 archaeon SCGC-AAA259E19]|uniref:Large ribosomal subunit protein eL43 n=1 Tax=candidate division MSBL1 archaeon SCGC-AAA259E19 TaxID=1698264 RepID=A0A133UNW5_9EURY|nr:hypothetical protein AKJ65_00195 [candidate division MSBL1 archaeon SCGC-AAA259E19]